MKLNQNYFNLQESYLFSTVAKKVADFQRKNPDKEIYRLGIGDVTLPLAPVVIAAMHAAVTEMAKEGSFRGYGPEQGYEFLRIAIKGRYAERGVAIDADEIFVSDGAKSDLGNVLDIFDSNSVVLMPDPVYPAYLDANLMVGRKVKFAQGRKNNDFKAAPKANVKADIIYLCSPNNPTGSVYTKAELEKWVEFAHQNGAVILFDAAYEAYVQDATLPRSIYEIDGAKECAIEICSLSKTAGFTGVRCGYTVVPKALANGVCNRFWLRRQTTKFNGVGYAVQCGAAAVFTVQGQREIKRQVAYYMDNARIMHEELQKAGIWHVGGENGPYLWIECPKGMTSWEYFDQLLNEVQVVGTPGVGFGAQGEGYLRLTAFGNKEKTKIAIKKLCEARLSNLK